MSGPLRRVRGSLGASVADGFGLSISSFTPKRQRRHYAVARSPLEVAQFAGTAARGRTTRPGILAYMRSTDSPVAGADPERPPLGRNPLDITREQPVVRA